MTRFFVVPQWQGSPAARAMHLVDGAEAIAGDLPRASTARVEVPASDPLDDALADDDEALDALLVSPFAGGRLEPSWRCGEATSSAAQAVRTSPTSMADESSARRTMAFQLSSTQCTCVDIERLPRVDRCSHGRLVTP